MDSFLPRFRNRRVRRVTPAIEGLEGRQLMAAGAMRVRVQELVTDAGVELVIQGSRRADIINIQDNGTSAAGNISVNIANGQAYTSTRAVTSIVVRGGLGRDQVRYDLTGTLTSARSAVIALGGGGDQFTGMITGDVATADALNLQVFGEAGDDRIDIVQTGATLSGVFFPYVEGNGGNDVLTFMSSSPIAMGATVGPALVGGAGNDWLKAEYSGQIHGQYLYNNTLEGNGGDDKLSNVIHAQAGSFGKVGESPTTPAAVVGGDGNDQVLYSIVVESEATVLAINSSISGGNGSDTVRRTSNVVRDTTIEDDGIVG